MKESVALAKDADAKKEFSSTRSDNSIHRVRNEPERQLGSLRSVIGNIMHDGGTPSANSIATELSSMHTAQRASVLLALQRTHGNRYVQRVVAGIQAKLVVGQPGDVYEQEADRVAEQVMRMPEPPLQRQAEEEEEEEETLQTKPLAEQITPLVQRQVEKEEEILWTKEVPGQTSEVTPDIESHINSIKASGQPLPKSVRNFFEPRFGQDFRRVRVHTDAKANAVARAVNARAFTVGRNVAFAVGQYAPESSTGKRLLAHELTHAIQQENLPSRIQRRIIVGGTPYTPTPTYYAYLNANFGSHMKEFIKNMHNNGNPPDFTFTSYEQMGYEVRVRHQAIKGIEAVHSGCCNYPDSAHPDHLDSTYWDRVDWMHFKTKSPLPSGKEASDAVEAIFAPGAGTRLECLAITVAVEYYSLLKGLGKTKFNAKFPGGAGLEISTSSSHLPLIFGAGRKYKIISVSSAGELLPGDWVYFRNFADYPARYPAGSWRGENAIYLGGGKYRGFGVASLTETDMNSKLVSKYNIELGESKTVANLLADGGGLELTPVVRPEIATLTP